MIKVCYRIYEYILHKKRSFYVDYLLHKGLTLGQGGFIADNARIFKPHRVIIGNNVHINNGVYINGGYGKVIIGNRVTLSPHSSIFASGYDLDKWIDTGERTHFENTETYVGDDTWICSGATILPNVKITGKFVVVAAGAVVNKDITEDYVVVGGVPAKIINRRRPAMKS